MNLPSISAICVTIGRVSCLNECIACFLSQRYDGEKQLVVLNTWPRQRLIGEWPGVKIINCETRPPNLGSARNMAIEAADGEIICPFDDDDIALEHHLENFGKHFDANTDWVWQDKMFYSEGSEVKQIVAGAFNVVAYRKTAWKQIGEFNDQTVGEDRQFVGRLTTQRPGKKVSLLPEEISYNYVWAQGPLVFHVSGKGERSSAHDEIGAYTEDLATRGVIPTGDIQLKPVLKHNYPRLVRDFINRNTQTERKPATFQGIATNTHPPYAPDIRLLNPLPKITVVYVIGSDTPEYNALAGRFASSYVACPPGLEHDTIIACNGIALNNVARKLWRCYPNCTLVRHDNSGWDIGAFIAVSQKLTSDFVVYFGSKSHFKRAGWLIRMVEAWKKYGPGFYGSTSSFEISPHINTSGFWCGPDLMRQYPIKVLSRQDRYNFEHGPDACWRMAVKLGLPAKLVTWDGEWGWPDWRLPYNIFRRGDQSNCLAYFEHTRRFDEADQGTREVQSRVADIITDPYFIRALKNQDYKLTGADEHGADYLTTCHSAPAAVVWDANLKHA